MTLPAAEIHALVVTAFTLGVVHTLLGPDHYVPLASLARARGWSLRRTLVLTAVCGLGHTAGSVLLGAFGIAAGAALAGIERTETLRGDVAAWALVAFGLTYGAWGLRRSLRRRPHAHPHVHADGTVHDHPHDHLGEHAHLHEAPGARAWLPWTLFIVFVLGPCEPLVPLLMYPAARHDALAVAIVVVVFVVATVATMTLAVWLVTRGVGAVPVRGIAPYAHAFAGGAMALCGVAVLAGL